MRKVKTIEVIEEVRIEVDPLVYGNFDLGMKPVGLVEWKGSSAEKELEAK